VLEKGGHKISHFKVTFSEFFIPSKINNYWNIVIIHISRRKIRNFWIKKMLKPRGLIHLDFSSLESFISKGSRKSVCQKKLILLINLNAEKSLTSFQHVSILCECIKMIKIKFTKNIIQNNPKLLSKYLYIFCNFLDFDRKKIYWIFPLQENSPIRAKKRPRLVKNCRGPRKSQFFCNTGLSKNFMQKITAISDLEKKKPKNFFWGDLKQKLLQGSIFCLPIQKFVI